MKSSPLERLINITDSICESFLTLAKNIIKELCDDFLDIDDSDTFLIKQKIVSIIDTASSSYPFNLQEVLKKMCLEKLNDKIDLIYTKYQEKKTNENLIDFNDLM